MDSNKKDSKAMSITTTKAAQQLAQETLFKELELLCAALKDPAYPTPYHTLDRKGRLKLVQSIYTTLALVESYSGGGIEKRLVAPSIHFCAHPDCPGLDHVPPHDECHKGGIL